MAQDKSYLFQRISFPALFKTPTRNDIKAIPSKSSFLTNKQYKNFLLVPINGLYYLIQCPYRIQEVPGNDANSNSSGFRTVSSLPQKVSRFRILLVTFRKLAKFKILLDMLRNHPFPRPLHLRERSPSLPRRTEHN